MTSKTKVAIVLQVGLFYHDLKQGVREIVSISDDKLIYRIRAAKQEKVWTRDGYQSEIGKEVECLASSFKSWAKSALTPEKGHRLLLSLEAKKLKLSATERVFIQAAAQKTGIVNDPNVQPSVGVYTIEQSEKRPAGALVKKGVILWDPKSTYAEFTPLGIEVLLDNLPSKYKEPTMEFIDA